MKYINTRDAYLNTINETFANETTWGGSLLGRLINSIIRKAKVEVNYQKVKSIAHAIKVELDGLIANGMDEKTRQEIAKVTAKAILEEIHKVVVSDETEQVKLYQLLDKNKDGLITQAINFLKALPDDTNIGRGTKDELIEKLEKFKQLLESINTEELTEEEKKEIENKVDEEEDPTEENPAEEVTKEIEDGHDLEEVPFDEEESGKPKGELDAEMDEEEEDPFGEIYKLLQTIVSMHRILESRKNTTTGKSPDSEAETGSETGLSGSKYDEYDDITHDTSREVVKSKRKNNPNVNITKKEPQLLKRSTRDLPQGNNTKQIGTNNNNQKLIGPSEGLLNFWDFYSNINEFKGIDSTRVVSKGKGYTKEPEWTVVNPGHKKEQPDKYKSAGDYTKFTDVKTDIWGDITRIWKKSGISEHIPMIISLLEKAKKEGSIERKWITRIGKQIQVNKLTHNRSMSEATSDVIATAIPKSISLLANGFSKIKISNKEDLSSLNDIGKLLLSFKKSYDIVSNAKRLDSPHHSELKEPEKEPELKALNAPSDKVVDHFLYLLKEAELPVPEHELETVPVEDEENNLTVQGAWGQVFEENEENEWALSDKEAKEAQSKIANSKFKINLTDEANKDRIIKIANLFGRAYRCFTTNVIPSGRPGGKVSNATFREYLHLGTGGSPGTPDAPGAGPWANKRVFHNFANYISSYIEHDEYKKIFNYGTITRTDGKPLKGNVLLEFIRDMIDETALKSYDKRRSEFLNKYFGLEGYTYKEPEGSTGVTNITKADHAEADETLQWQSVNNITTSNIGNIQKGSFLSFYVKYKLEGKKEEHGPLIGQVLDIIDGNKIIFKWQEDSESIPHAYAGAVLTHGYSYTTTDLKKTPKTTSAPKEPLLIGLIDISLKMNTGGNETQGIYPNHKFFMASKDITKPDDASDKNFHRVHYIPYKNKPGVVNRVIKNAISILVKTDKQGNNEPVIGKLNTLASKSIIPNDTIVDLDQVVDQLTNYMARNKDKI